MLRLCSKSSRSYPVRPVRHAVKILTAPDTATYRVIRQESAEAIVGEGNHHSWWRGGWKRARRIEKMGGLIPPKGQTRSMGNSPYVLRNAMNPTG